MRLRAVGGHRVDQALGPLGVHHLAARHARGEVDHGIDVLHRGCQAGPLRQVQLHLAALSRVPGSDDHVVAPFCEPRHDQTSEPACPTGHEYFHRLAFRCVNEMTRQHRTL